MADQSHADDTLFESDDGTEKKSPSASTGEENGDEKPTDSTEENTENDLDLDEGEDKAQIVERKRKQEESAWLRKIESGEKSLDDLPERQAWLKPILEKRLSEAKKAKEVSEQYDVDSLLDQKFAERESQRNFTSMKLVLDETSLTSEQKRELNAEFKEFREAGLPKDKALQKALKIVGVELPDTDTLRQRMALPKAGRRDDTTGDIDPRDKYPKGSKERLRALDQAAKEYGA